ncbi:MAG: hypothetical protein FWD70_05040 [Desulfuromonadales bacterium]|nr:hypothetical protein [Desulfuromonadales bacterium]
MIKTFLKQHNLLVKLFLFAAIMALPIFAGLKTASATSTVEDSAVGMFNQSDESFTEAAVIPFKVGGNFGFIMKINTDQPKVQIKEELILPAPGNWGPEENGFSISKDRKTGTVIQEAESSDGEIYYSGAWEFAEGDPTGNYTINVYLDGQLVKTFNFTVTPPEKQNTVTSPEKK